METRPQPPAQGPVEPFLPSQPARRSVHWGRRLGVGLLVLVVAVFVAHALWGRREAKRLEAQLAGYRAAGEPVTVDELNRWAEAVSGSGENAVPPLRDAAAAVDDKSDVYRTFVEAERLLPLTDAEVAAYEAALKENSKALAAVDEAAGKTRVDWELAFTSPMFADPDKLFDVGNLRRLSNLLQGDGLLAHQRGDEARALRRVAQILLLSRIQGHQPTLVCYLMSVGLSAQASALAAEIAPDLSIKEPATRELVRSVIAQLLDERSLDDARRRGFMGERVFEIDTVIAMIQGTIGAKSVLVSGAGGKPGAGPPVAGYLMRPIFLQNAQAMAAHLTAVMKATAESPDLATYRAKAPKSPKDSDASVRNMLLQILLPSLDRAVTQHYRCVGDRRLAAICLAVRLYAADHDGRFPNSLEDLVPAYLPAVPLDPLAGGGKPLAYVSESADPKDPRVYDVGENGVDNGGVEPDPSLPRRDREKLTDEIRHLKRQPRPKPSEP